MAPAHTVEGGEPHGPPPQSEASDRHLKLALALGQMATWSYDRATESVTWSEPIEQVLGYESGTAGFKLHSPIGPRRYPGLQDSGPAETGHLGAALLSPILACLRAEMPWEHYELGMSFTGPGGKNHEVIVRAAPASSDGTYLGVVADISERNGVELALQELIDRYRLLSDLSPDGIVVHQDGVIKYCNKAAALNLVKLESIEEGLGQMMVNFLHPDDLADTLDRISRLSKPGAVSESGEARIVATDGTITTVDAISVRTEWEGRPAYQVIMRDISERRLAEAAIRHQASLVAHVSDAILGIDSEGRLESWNPAAQAMYGWTEAEVLSRPVAEVLAPGQAKGAAVVETGVRVHVHKDGRLIDTRVSLAPIVDKQGQPSGWVAVCTEITAARRAEEGRRAAEERYAAVIAALEEGVVVLDDAGHVTSHNDAAQRILGSRLNSQGGHDIFAGPHVATHKDGTPFPAAEFPAARTLATGKPQAHVIMGVVKDNGTSQWLSISSRLLTDEGGGQARTVVCSFSDVTERRAAEAQLNWQANHDSLTGLANRAFFLRTSNLTLATARQNSEGVAVLFIDLDRFKLVNDSLGHGAGDEVLMSAALRLEGAVGPRDLVSRLAGDEFAVLCRDVASIEDAVRQAEQLLEVLAEPMSVSIRKSVSVTASVGVAFAARDTRGAQDLLQDADVAMFKAKERGRARVEIFDEDLRLRAMTSLEDTEHLRHAIARNELVIHYQAMAEPGNDRIVGIEALIRWQHPTRGFLPPMDFIPLAEETGLILPLGRWMLSEACASLAQFRRELPGAEDANVSVNLSARQLSDPELIPAITTALNSSGLPASALIMEVTETALMADAASAMLTLAEIRALGVGLAIDDFGTGYSSLAYLRSFPVDYLKIDKSFVSGLGDSSEDEAIVSAIVNLAHALNLIVVAEGVETTQQRAQIRDLGCDLYQGYLLSRPVPSDKVAFSAPVLGPSPFQVATP